MVDSNWDCFLGRFPNQRASPAQEDSLVGNGALFILQVGWHPEQCDCHVTKAPDFQGQGWWGQGWERQIRITCLHLSHQTTTKAGPEDGAQYTCIHVHVSKMWRVFFFFPSKNNLPLSLKIDGPILLHSRVGLDTGKGQLTWDAYLHTYKEPEASQWTTGTAGDVPRAQTHFDSIKTYCINILPHFFFEVVSFFKK